MARGAQARSARVGEVGAVGEDGAVVGSAGHKVVGGRSKMPLRQRFWAYLADHGMVAVALIGLAVLAGFGLTFWFAVFSGLAQSADFIYSQF